MIHGVGTDIVNIPRIEKILAEKEQPFLAKIFSEAEISAMHARNFAADEKRISYIAKRFAAKEACAKALGTGIGANASFKEIEISSEGSGKPVLTLSGNAYECLRKLYPPRTEFKLHLSLTDDYPYAQAFVVIETIQSGSR